MSCVDVLYSHYLSKFTSHLRLSATKQLKLKMKKNLYYVSDVKNTRIVSQHKSYERNEHVRKPWTELLLYVYR